MQFEIRPDKHSKTYSIHPKLYGVYSFENKLIKVSDSSSHGSIYRMYISNFSTVEEAKKVIDLWIEQKTKEQKKKQEQENWYNSQKVIRYP